MWAVVVAGPLESKELLVMEFPGLQGPRRRLNEQVDAWRVVVERTVETESSITGPIKRVPLSHMETSARTSRGQSP